jgi:SAM-dependent methyltransferase
MNIGEADLQRLAILGRYYDPASRAFLESIGLGEGDVIADIGCGHGAMTAWLAGQVAATGKVYAVDSSPEQLAIARERVGHHPNVELICARVEDGPIGNGRADWVYSRFLLMHVGDALAALRAMAVMLKPEGRLLLEMADVATLKFLPAHAASELWAKWWFALGRSLKTSYDVAERVPEILSAAGFVIERSDRFQPVSSLRDAKLLHALGFEQLIPTYIEHAGARRDEIDAHLAYLRDAVADPAVSVELYRNTQYVARKR